MSSTRVQPELVRLALRRASDSIALSRSSRAPWWWVAALPLVAGAAMAMARLPVPVRVAGVLLGVAAALVLLYARWPSRSRAAGWIVVDAKGVSRQLASSEGRLFFWAERFGITVLASESGMRGILAITTSQQTRTIPIRVQGPDDARAAEALFAQSAMLSDSDVAFAPRGLDEALSAGDAARLVAKVAARDHAAMSRILLTDPRGAPIALDGSELRAGERLIDLALPLEWRSFHFVESVGTLGAVVQATWVRQNGVEFVLVAPQADARDPLPRNARPSSLPESAPPPEQRVAVERLFMSPFRHALDRAPRASRTSSAYPSARPEASRPT
jgi:hypothetical protein